MKKVLALLLVGVMSLSMVACGAKPAEAPAAEAPAEEAPAAEEEAPAAEEPAVEMADEVTLWTYPIGGWGDEAQVAALTDAFTAETGIKVNVEYLTYADGDDKVNGALSAGQAPDLIMEGPERLVANWGAKGYMVDLTDLIEDDLGEIYASVSSACKSVDGAFYEYPLVMTAHCMAVNVDAFKEAGADQYLDLDSHTWTTEDFKAAVAALNDKFGGTVGAVFCGGQGGDQGTRALINNLYGGTFTDEAYTTYTWDDANNIKALEELAAMDGINYDSSIVGGDEISLFYNETLKMAFCWNIAQQLNPNSADTGAEKTVGGQQIAFMSFPSETGESKLCGGIWGFGIFNSGDEARINAAKEFIRYMADSDATLDAVKTANYFAVRDSINGTDATGIWADNAIMNEYTKLMPFLGDYYQVVPGWAEARTAWWNMLQKVGEGGDATEVVAKFCAEANAAAGN